MLRPNGRAGHPPQRLPRGRLRREGVRSGRIDISIPSGPGRLHHFKSGPPRAICGKHTLPGSLQADHPRRGDELLHVGMSGAFGLFERPGSADLRLGSSVMSELPDRNVSRSSVERPSNCSVAGDDEGRIGMSVDMRTRPISAAGPSDPESFFQLDWREALALNGRRAASDAARLALGPLTIRIDGGGLWTMTPWEDTIDVVPGETSNAACVTLDRSAFADLSCERRTAMGLIVAGRGQRGSRPTRALLRVGSRLRSLLDGRPLYRSGTVTLQSLDGSPLQLDQRFRLGERTTEAAHFLAETGFLLLQGVFTDAEMDEIDADLTRAVDSARMDDGASWWAKTRSGDHYPCRILDFASKRPCCGLFFDPRYTAIGALLGDGHSPCATEQLALRSPSAVTSAKCSPNDRPACGHRRAMPRWPCTGGQKKSPQRGRLGCEVQDPAG